MLRVTDEDSGFKKAHLTKKKWFSKTKEIEAYTFKASDLEVTLSRTNNSKTAIFVTEYREYNGIKYENKTLKIKFNLLENEVYWFFQYIKEGRAFNKLVAEMHMENTEGFICRGLNTMKGWFNKSPDTAIADA